MTAEPPAGPGMPTPPEASPGAPPAAPPPPAPTPTPASSWESSFARAPSPGPAPGLVYAGIGRRIVAYVIDIVLAGIAASGFALLVVVPLALSGRQDDPASNLILQTVLFLVFAGYFILAWRQRRATLGQLMFGLVVGNEADGSKLTWGAAFIRWLALTLGPLPALLALVTPADLGALGTMLQLVWFIVLLVTTATSPTMQGLHDRWAHSLVVRRA